MTYFMRALQGPSATFGPPPRQLPTISGKSVPGLKLQMLILKVSLARRGLQAEGSLGKEIQL